MTLNDSKFNTIFLRPQNTANSYLNSGDSYGLFIPEARVNAQVSPRSCQLYVNSIETKVGMYLCYEDDK
jgi:hypothetical protein